MLKIKDNVDLKELDFYNLDWVYINRGYGNICIGKGMEVLNSYIQPEKDEMLIKFAFPTGAYIFGGYYDKKAFNEFFDELKTFNYKYIDDINSCLYYDMENGAKLFNKYQEICNKYQKKWDKRAKEKKKEELKKQLADLESKGD